MSRVISAGTATGRVELTQNALKEFTYNLFSGSKIDIERLISVFDNSCVETRHISVPIDWLKNKHSFSERNKIFIKEAFELSKKAVDQCLKDAKASYQDIDNIIFITSTGLSTPTIDALLFNEFKFNKHIKRTPIWGLGCAGGAAGISKAYEFTKAFPEKNALVVAVELCSLTFQKDDLSKSNVIAASLFSDGAGAVLVSGEKSKFYSQKGLDILDSLSTIYDNTLDIMGWDIVDDGFKVIFSRDIPTIVKELVYKNIKELLDAHNLEVKDIKHFVTHPGGLKVINAYEESLSLPAGTLKYARKILKNHGNMSSPSVLFVLKEFLNSDNYNPGEWGLLSSLGPGFSSELVLFKTT
jgi:alkylresorcinol/alkylpyrone synthase